MDGDQGRFTWRTDRRFTQCPRDDAGAYFRFLASVGYELSPIEQAVADGVPFGDTGDQPVGPTEPDEPVSGPDAPDSSESGDHEVVAVEQESPETE